MCDDGWNTRNAEIVCRQLHYDGCKFQIDLFVQLFILLNFPTASYPLIRQTTNNRPLYHLDNVHCNGNESMLSECPHNGIGIHTCYGRGEAGVICTSEL